jgi:1,4-alpha-glucan branching enzyme
MSSRTPHPAPDTAKGALALVLHSHMPYVEGFGTWPFGEEWLWEAVATVYLPLLRVVRGHAVTVGLTPVLSDQLETLPDDGGERFLTFLRDVRAPVHEMDAKAVDAPLAAELRRAAGDYKHAEHVFTVLGGDLLRAFRDTPGIELWTSSATHAVLPLVATEPGRELQVSAGVASHERRFAAWTGGFWLPECAYEPGLERELAQYGARCFCVDQTAALGHGSLDQLEPVATEAGPVAVPIDWQTIELIWSDSGYPSDPVYRDYHGRTTHDLRPWNNGGEPYDHDAALGHARRHARQFLDHVEARLSAYRAGRGRPGLLCCALDTELLGHWWYEGPEFLRELLKGAEEHGVDLVTLPAALDRFEPVERTLAASTWGEGKDLSTWDSPKVADLLFDTRAAELRTIAAAARCDAPGGPALERAARELLAAQASDWAFSITRESAGDYPWERARGHLQELEAALSALTNGSAAEPEPAVHNLAPHLDLSPLLAP